MKKYLYILLAAVAAVSFITAGLLTAFEAAVYGDFDYYQKEYEKYEVAQALDMDMPEIMRVTEYMMSYLRGGEEELSIVAEVEGKEQDFFNEQDRFHMGEVRDLFLGGLTLRNTAVVILFLSVGLLVLLKGKVNRLLPRVYQGTMGIILLLVVVGGGVISQDFNKYFVIFHEIFFDNDLWIFDPATDYMIRMLPEGFFYDMTMRIGVFFLGFLVVTLAASVVWRILYGRSDKKNK